MIQSRAHRLGEPVIVALGSRRAPEGDVIDVDTLLVAPGLPAGRYVMMRADTGEEVGTLELPEELANGHAWKATTGEPIDTDELDDDVEPEGDEQDDEDEDDD